MNKKLLISLSIFLFVAGNGWGASPLDPLENGMGARALGMGKAIVGLADGSEAIFINPAGLASLNRLGLLNMYSSPYLDTGFVVLGAAIPSALGGVLGAGYSNLTTYQVPVSDEAADYTQQALNLLYSFAIDKNLSAAAGIKIFSKGISKGSAPKITGSGYDLDLSLKSTPRPWLGLGLNIQNILPSSLGARVNLASGGMEGFPLTYKGGSSFKLWGENSLFGNKKQKLFLNLDLEKADKAPLLFRWGAEWWPVNFFALRGGFDQSATANDGQTLTHLALGFGLRLSGIILDFAYYQRGDATKRVEHYFSLSNAEPATKKTATVESFAQVKRKQFNDVAADHFAKDAIENLAGLGVISGYADGTFKPNKPVSRVEMLVLLIRTLPSGEVDKIRARSFAVAFNDLTLNHWAASFIGWSLERGIVTGFPDKTFRPSLPISRAAGITIATRFADIKTARVLELPFEDVSARHWAITYITAAKEAGLLEYYGKKLEPDKGLTRAEAALMLYRTKNVQNLLRKKI